VQLTFDGGNKPDCAKPETIDDTERAMGSEFGSFDNWELDVKC